MEQPSVSPLADRTRRRITRRLLPFLFVLYIIAFLDRVNVGYAALEMTNALGFTTEVYGFGAGIFFIGYFLLEIPGSLIVEKWSARRWIARIMISWGVVAILMGFIHSAAQFYVLRFLLGAAEAGFFPGIIVYLSHWFSHEDRAKAIAMFMAAIPVSNVIGAPISGILLEMNWFGIAGWRWLFIIEGIPAIVFGVVTLFYLTDRPHQAKWLSDDEREWIASELEQERRTMQNAHSYSILGGLRAGKLILLTTAFFLIVTSGYGFILWLPSFIKKVSGSSNLEVTLITAIPYSVGLLSMLITGWSSDRRKERHWHTAVPMIIAALGLFLSAVLQNRPALAVGMFCVAAAGLHAYLPGFWSLPTSFLTGSAAAVAIGLINSIGNLGGFLGPYVVGYISEITGSFASGIIFLSVSSLIAGALIIVLRESKMRVVPNVGS